MYRLITMNESNIFVIIIILIIFPIIHVIIDQSKISSNIEFKLYGGSASFICNGLFFVEWKYYVDVDPMKITINDSKLTITDITEREIGAYTCQGYTKREDKNDLFKKISAMGLLLVKGTTDNTLIRYQC